MADRKISDLTALTTPASGDFLPIVDISEVAAASKNKRITIEELMRGMPDGTAAAPSIAFESDPNTGIYSPGADQVAISTNGTGRLFVDASGNVGVGSSSPNKWLDAGITQGTFKGILTGAVNLEGDRPTNSDIGRLAFWQTTNRIAYIAGARDGAENSGAIRFVTNNAGAEGERMRLTSAGLLGLGTSSPTERLEVTGNLKLSSIGTGNTASSYDLLFFGTTSAGTQTDQAKIHSSTWTTNSNGGNLQFYTSNASNAITERMRIDGAGNVGIGTTTPQTQLHIYENSSSSAILRLENTENFAAIRADNDILYLEGSAQVFRTNAGTERARIDSSGRLLVGTSTVRNVGSAFPPQFQLESPNSGIAGLTVVTNRSDTIGPSISLAKSRGGSVGSTAIVADGDTLGELRFCGADGTDIETVGARIAANVDGTPGANDLPSSLVFSTTADGSASPTERLRITSAGVLQVADAGNITVGTTTGTKIGTATTQKLGFYNATPVVQPAAVADATTAVDVITQLNDLLAKLRTLGIIAT